MGFQLVSKALLVGMPPRFAAAAQVIADGGGVAVIGRAMSFGERGIRGLPQYVFAHAVANAPRVPLFAGHAGESEDPDGDDVAHQVGTCIDVQASAYGLDYLWQVDDNATALNRLRSTIAAGGAGLSLEDDQSRRTEWVGADPRDHLGKARRVSAMTPTGVALVADPAHASARVAAVVSERATYVYSPAHQRLLIRAGDSDGSALLELEERATAAGRSDPEMTQVCTNLVESRDQGTLIQGYRWKRGSTPMATTQAPGSTQPRYDRHAAPFYNSRGQRVEIGPVVPIGWTG